MTDSTAVNGASARCRLGFPSSAGAEGAGLVPSEHAVRTLGSGALPGTFAWLPEPKLAKPALRLPFRAITIDSRW